MISVVSVKSGSTYEGAGSIGYSQKALREAVPFKLKMLKWSVPTGARRQTVIKRSEEEWAAIIKEYNESGMSLTAFGQEKGISLKTLANHTRSGRMYPLGKAVPNKRTANEWAELMADMAASGLTQEEWCRQNGINKSALSSALRRKREGGVHTQPLANPNRPAFVKVQAPGMAEDTADGHIKIEMGGVVIDADSAYPIDALIMLARRLAPQC
jgi:lambda repressor-like predicted transcriptional regulator